MPNSDGEDRIEPESVADLYRQHAVEMRSFLTGVLRDRELADEVLQTVFRRALEKGHTATENVRSWLFKVAWNEAMLVRRVQTRRAGGLQKAARSRGVSEATPEESESAAVRQESVEQVRKAIQQLPDEQQLVVGMRIYEEKKFAVIAEELGVPLGTVLSRMRAAMMKLEKSLGQHFDERVHNGADPEVSIDRKQIMSEVTKQSEPNDEPLSWLAFRYISDEMSQSEVDAFEARLNPASSTYEEAASEAVARAVQLSDVVAAAFGSVKQPAAQSAFDETSRRDLIARRMSVLAASITVLAVGWALSLPTQPQPVKVVDSPALPSLETESGQLGELVLIWADSGNELLSVIEEVPQLPPASGVPEYFSTDVPEWLLAAVQSHDASPDDPEVLEN